MALAAYFVLASEVSEPDTHQAPESTEQESEQQQQTSGSAVLLDVVALLQALVATQYTAQVVCDDHSQAEALADALFCAELSEFVPHCFEWLHPRAQVPVILSVQPSRRRTDVIINLSQQPLPPRPATRISIDWVGTTEAEKQSSRALFREYRQRGWQVEALPLSQLLQLIRGSKSQQSSD